MKILAFSDVHANKRAIDSILHKSKHADFLICAGDLSNFGHQFEHTIKLLSKAGKKILMIHGNHEMEEDVRHAAKRYPAVLPIHKKPFAYGNYLFIGFGGGGFSFIDEDMESFFTTFKKQQKYRASTIVFVTHAPPYKTKLDYLPWLGHRGCKSIIKVIKMIKPIVHISGHFHETSGRTDMLGKTLLVNPGPFGKLIPLP